jgi:hypothetical protein
MEQLAQWSLRVLGVWKLWGSFRSRMSVSAAWDFESIRPVKTHGNSPTEKIILSGSRKIAFLHSQGQKRPFCPAADNPRTSAMPPTSDAKSRSGQSPLCAQQPTHAVQQLLFNVKFERHQRNLCLSTSRPWPASDGPGPNAVCGAAAPPQQIQWVRLLGARLVKGNSNDCLRANTQRSRPVGQEQHVCVFGNNGRAASPGTDRYGLSRLRASARHRL